MIKNTFKILFLVLIIFLLINFYIISYASINELSNKMKQSTTISENNNKITNNSTYNLDSKNNKNKLVLINASPNNFNGEGNNTCGQYAISVILNHFKIDEKYYETVKKSNPTGSFTAPTRIIEYLKNYGISCKYKNKSTILDIKQQIDSGIPAICLVNSGDAAHWITIVGYRLDDNNKIKSVIMRDSYWGIYSNFEMDINEFKTKWKSPLVGINKILDEALSYENLMIAPLYKLNHKKGRIIYESYDTLTDDQISSGLNLFLLGLGQDITKIKSIKDFDFKKINYSKVILGATEMLSALPQKLLFDLQSKNLEKSGKIISEVGKQLLQSKDIKDKFVGQLINNVGKFITNSSKVVNLTGNLISQVTQSGFNTIKNILNW